MNKENTAKFEIQTATHSKCLTDIINISTLNTYTNIVYVTKPKPFNYMEKLYSVLEKRNVQLKKHIHTSSSVFFATNQTTVVLFNAGFVSGM